MTEKNLLDHVKLLKGIDASTRRSFFTTLLKGLPATEGQPSPGPGAEAQYMAALVEHRSAEGLVLQMQAAVAAITGAELKAQAQAELDWQMWDLAKRAMRLESLGLELGRLQDAIEEIDNAGVKA